MFLLLLCLTHSIEYVIENDLPEGYTAFYKNDQGNEVIIERGTKDTQTKSTVYYINGGYCDSPYFYGTVISMKTETKLSTRISFCQRQMYYALVRANKLPYGTSFKYSGLPDTNSNQINNIKCQNNGNGCSGTYATRAYDTYTIKVEMNVPGYICQSTFIEASLESISGEGPVRTNILDLNDKFNSICTKTSSGDGSGSGSGDGSGSGSGDGSGSGSGDGSGDGSGSGSGDGSGSGSGDGSDNGCDSNDWNDLFKFDPKAEIRSFDLMVSLDSENIKKCIQAESEIKELREDCKMVTKKDEEYGACQLLSKMKGLHCVSPEGVNDAISKLPSGTDLLFLLIYGDTHEPIDFNKLKGERVVVLTSLSSVIDLSNIKKSLLLNRFQSIKDKHKTIKKTFNVDIVGNVGSHVPFLMLGSLDGTIFNYKVTGSPLNVENIFIANTRQAEDSLAVKSKYVYNIVDPINNFEIDQLFGLVIPTCKKIKIRFHKNTVSFNGFPQDIHVPKKVGVVSKALFYEISADDDATLKPINITQYNIIDSIAELYGTGASLNKYVIPELKDDTDRKIQITGYLENVLIPEDFQILVTYDSSKYNVDISSLSRRLRDKVDLQDTRNKPKNGFPIGAIISIVLGCLIVVGVAVFLGVWFGVIKKNHNGSSNQQFQSTTNI